jgi:LmbE family N-acetylglucosaminyl deacetylase
VLVPSAAAQRTARQLDAGEILHRIEKLGVVGSVLYVGAHPDDENTRLISWLANGAKVRAAYLSLTRGDGGQNLIGTELGDALGILRTQELLAARRIDGGEQFFTRAVDFGYSKTPEETFAKWGRQEILSDVVRVVRTFRPDVIVTRFATDGSGGHGHHTASAILANEAFELAADPKAFPEQIAEGLEPWQAKRLFFNAAAWWNPSVPDLAKKDPEHWVAVDVGGYDPLLGASYGEIAGKSRSQHKSQGFGAAETRGSSLEYLHLQKGAPVSKPDLLDGVDLGWSRVAGAERVPAIVREIVSAFDARAPEKSVPKLAELVRVLDGITGPGRSWAGFQASAGRELILQVAGVVVDVGAGVPQVASGDSTKATLSVLQRAAEPKLSVVRFSLPGSAPVDVGEELAANRPWTKELVYAVPSSQPIDQPYWLASSHEGLFRPDGRGKGIEPVARGAALVRCVLRLADALGGLEIPVDAAVTQTWVDRVAGERTRPVVVTPPASIEVPDGVAIVRGDRAEISAELLALRDDLSGAWKVEAPAGWKLEAPPAGVDRLRRGERRALRIALRKEGDARGGPVRLSFAGPQGESAWTMHVIDHPHVPPQTWFSPAEVTLVPLDVAVATKTVGYVEGAGDEVPAALKRLGIAVEKIDPKSASADDLDRCDAIVTGIRAYNTVQALATFQPKLLAYVERGGTLVVQYDTNGNDLVLPAKAIGPYPFALTRDRVTVEEATPTFLAPAHPLWTTPNRLTMADFAGWVQERGLYFAGEVDPAYTALISWSDPGEAPLSGALIACDSGKGRFVYTGLSLFRQLPAGVPGAYRLLANLLARRTRQP